MDLIKSYAEALQAVINQHDVPKELYNTTGFEALDSFWVPPAEDSPEGLPCYRVYKESGEAVRKDRFASMKEGGPLVRAASTKVVSA